MLNKIAEILGNGDIKFCIHCYTHLEGCCVQEDGFINLVLLPGEKEKLQKLDCSNWDFIKENGFDKIKCYKKGICNERPIDCSLFPFYPIEVNKDNEKSIVIADFPRCPIIKNISDDVKQHFRNVFNVSKIILKEFPGWMEEAVKDISPITKFNINYEEIDYLTEDKYKIITTISNKSKYDLYNTYFLIKYFDNLNKYINNITCINFKLPIVFEDGIPVTHIDISQDLPFSDCYMIDKVELFSRDELLSLLKKVFEHTEYIILYSKSNLLDMIPYKILIHDGFYIIVNELPEVSKYHSLIDWTENLKFNDSLPYNNTFSTEIKNNDLIITNATEEDLTYLKYILDPLKFNNVVANGFYKYIFGWKNEVNGNLTMEK